MAASRARASSSARDSQDGPQQDLAVTSSASHAADAAAGYGAATASLSDPACKKGTPEFDAARARNMELLEQYRRIKKSKEDEQAFKPDMQAFKSIRSTNPVVSVYGHVPGVAVGEEFVGRGELAVLGLHSQMMRGIDNKQEYGDGALAICLSGGYRDNKDTGTTFDYTGAGGQDKQRRHLQVEDQTFENAGNAALRRNFETGTPVRVFRARPGESGAGPIYVYEGLYKVIGYHMKPSSDGPLVIQFTLQGVPGHSAANVRVEFRALSRAKAFQKVVLAGAADGDKKEQQQRKAPKGYIWCFDVPDKAEVLESINKRKEAGTHGRLVVLDIADGQEKLPIPAWNDVDGSDKPFVASNMVGLPVSTTEDLTFQYIPDYEFQEYDNALQLAKRAEELSEFQSTCATKYHDGRFMYTEENLLTISDGYGLMECPPNCKGVKGKNGGRHRCQGTRVVAEGMRYPLEVYKVPGKGWGVRCSMDLAVGAVLCAYVGVIITNDTAEEQWGADTYFYDLNHFHLLEEAEEAAGQQDEERNPRLPRVPAELKEHHLVVDASHEGNIARFFNHSCDPNCLTQVVFTKGARSHLLHYVVIVAAEDIPKYTELTYDYGNSYIIQAEDGSQQEAEPAAAAAGSGARSTGRRIRCTCGARNCRGWLRD